MKGVQRTRRHPVKIMLVAAGLMGVLTACESKDPDEQAAQYMQSGQEELAKGNFNAAVIELKNGVQAAPRNPDARLALGRTHLTMARYPEAAKELRRALDYGAEPAVVWPLLLESYLKQGEFDRTLSEIASLPSDIANQSDVQVIKVDALLSSGQSVKARTAMPAVDRSGPAMLVRHARLAAADDALDDAEDLARKALESDPENVEALVLLAQLVQSPDTLDRSEELLTKAVSLDPFEPTAAYTLAAVKIQRGAFEDAETTLNQFAKRTGGQSLASLHLRSLIAVEQGDFSQAKTISEQILGAQPNFTPAMFVAGIANSALGNDDMAVTFLERIQGGSPQAQATALKALARSGIRSGRADAFLSALEAADTSVRDSELLQLAAAAAMSERDYDRAKQLFEQILASAPEDADTATNLAALQLATGNAKEAERLIGTLTQDLENQNLEGKARLALLQLRSGKPQEALKIAEAIQRERSDLATGYTLAGIAHFSLGDRETAETDLRAALERSPNDEMATLLLSAMLRAQDKGDAAGALLKQAAQARPERARLLAAYTSHLVSNNQVADATAFLETVVEENPELLDAKVVFARHLLNAREPQRAIDTVEAVLNEAPMRVDALETKGRAHWAMGEGQAALSVFEKMVEAQPDAPEPHLLLAQAHANVGNRRQAIDSLERTIDLDDSRLDAHLLLGRLLLDTNREDRAGDVIETLAERAPEEPEVMALQADLARIEGRTGDAVTHYKALYDAVPNIRTAQQYSLALWRDGQQETATRTLSDALDQTDNVPAIAHMQLGQFYLRLDQRDKAVAAYKVAADRFQDDVSAQNDYAWMLFEDGRYGDALPYAERALELAPRSAEVQDTLGMILLERGDVDRALTLLQQASQEKPDSDQIRLHFAKALIAAEQTSKARRELDALKTSDDPSVAEEARTMSESLAPGP